jgi:hypothetical protein
MSYVLNPDKTMIEEKPKTDERRKWLKEIKSASKAEDTWRNKCKTITCDCSAIAFVDDIL